MEYPDDHINYDQELGQLLGGDIRIISYSPGKIYLRLYPKKDGLDQGRTALTTRLKRILVKHFVLPDTTVESLPSAVRLCKKLLSQNRYDVIFSVHEPPSGHLIGLLSSRNYTSKWVAYWSDPWIGDLLRLNQWWGKKLIERTLESLIVEYADKLLFSSEALRDMYILRYRLSLEKCSVVYRGYDPDLFRRISAQKAPDEMAGCYIPIVYVGSIFKGVRNIEPFLTAVSRLESRHAEFGEKVLFFFVGHIDESLKAKLLRFRSIRLIGNVPYLKALSYLVHAKLLLFWGNGPGVQIPGKLYEYFGSNSPILGIVDDMTDPSYPLLRSANKGPIVRNNSQLIEQEILKCIHLLESNEVPISWLNPIKEFGWDEIVRRLEIMLSALCSRK
jgi:glycosyltransferase involved in cell wall biosynthesis